MTSSYCSCPSLAITFPREEPPGPMSTNTRSDLPPREAAQKAKVSDAGLIPEPTITRDTPLQPPSVPNEDRCQMGRGGGGEGGG